MKYYAGPWQWKTPESGAYYASPDGTVAVCDLRNMPTQAAGDHSGGVGNGFFACANDITLPTEYALIGAGDLRETNISSEAKSAWESLYGVALNGGVTKILDALSYTLGDGSDPDGIAGPKPLIPGVSPNGEVQIHLAGHSIVYRRKMSIISGTSQHARKIRDLLKKDLKATHDQGDDLLWRKVLGYQKRKYGQAWDDPDEDWILTPAMRAKGKGSNGRSRAEHPATTYTESWPTNSAITSSQDQAWSYLTGYTSGSFSVSSGQVACISDNGTRYARMGSALSGSDVYAELVYKSFTGIAEDNSVGVMARKDSNDGTITFYRGDMQSYPVSSSTSRIYKVVTATPTSLSTSSSYAGAANDVVQLECNGSALKVYVNAVEKTSVTDTAISSGTYCGLWSYGGGTKTHVTDDWECGDLGGATATPKGVFGLALDGPMRRVVY